MRQSLTYIPPDRATIKSCITSALRGLFLCCISIIGLTAYANPDSQRAVTSANPLSEREQILFNRLAGFNEKPLAVGYDDVLQETVWQVSEAYYRQFSYNWTDASGNSHTANITETASDPNQIIALLKYVYSEPLIPGFRRDRYYHPEEPQSAFQVRNNYDGIDGSYPPPDPEKFLNRENNAFPNRADYVTVPYDDCFFGPFGPKPADFATRKVEEPLNGATALLVEMKDEYDGETLNLFPRYKLNEIYDEGIKALNYIAAVTLIPRQFYASNEATGNPGFIFNTEASLSKCFIVTKGNNRPYKAFEHRMLVTRPNTADISDDSAEKYATLADDGSDFDPANPGDKKPLTIDGGAIFYNMYEEFSPSNLGPKFDAYKDMNSGSTFHVDHNCSSVVKQEHDVVFGPKSNRNAKYNINLLFFMPDRRFDGITNFTPEQWARRSELESKTDRTDDEEKELAKLATGPYAPYSYYAPEYRPYFFFNRIYANMDSKITIPEGQTFQTADGNEIIMQDMALVPLHWESLYKKIINPNALESFHVYRMVNGEISTTPVKWEEIVIRKVDGDEKEGLTYVDLTNPDSAELLREFGPNVEVFIIEKNAAERAGQAVRYIIYGTRHGSGFRDVESNVVVGFLPTLNKDITIRLHVANSQYEAASVNNGVKSPGRNVYSNELHLVHTGYSELVGQDGEITQLYDYTLGGNLTYSDLLIGDMKSNGNSASIADISDVRLRDVTLQFIRKDDITHVENVIMSCNLANSGSSWLSQNTWKVSGTNDYNYAVVLNLPFVDADGNPTESKIQLAYEWFTYQEFDKQASFRPLGANNELIARFVDTFSQNLQDDNYPSRYQYVLRVVPNTRSLRSSISTEAENMLESNSTFVDVPKRSYRIGYEGYTLDQVLNDFEYDNALSVNRAGVAYTVSNNPNVNQYTFMCETHGRVLARVERYPGGIYRPYITQPDQSERRLDQTLEGYSGELSLILDNEVYSDDNLVMVLEYHNTKETLYTNGNTYGFPIKKMPAVPSIPFSNVNAYYYDEQTNPNDEITPKIYACFVDHGNLADTGEEDVNPNFGFAGYSVHAMGQFQSGETGEYVNAVHEIGPSTEDWGIPFIGFNHVFGTVAPSNDDKVTITTASRIYSEILKPELYIPEYNPAGTESVSRAVGTRSLQGTGMYVVSPYINATDILGANKVTTEVDGILDNENSEVEYYNLQGMKISQHALTPGIYIRRQGNTSEKVLIR